LADKGEEMIIIAHVVNKGAAPSSEVKYVWMLDGESKNEQGWSER